MSQTGTEDSDSHDEASKAHSTISSSSSSSEESEKSPSEKSASKGSSADKADDEGSENESSKAESSKSSSKSSSSEESEKSPTEKSASKGSSADKADDEDSEDEKSKAKSSTSSSSSSSEESRKTASEKSSKGKEKEKKMDNEDQRGESSNQARATPTVQPTHGNMDAPNVPNVLPVEEAVPRRVQFAEADDTDSVLTADTLDMLEAEMNEVLEDLKAVSKFKEDWTGRVRQDTKDPRRWYAELNCEYCWKMDDRAWITKEDKVKARYAARKKAESEEEAYDILIDLINDALHVKRREAEMLSVQPLLRDISYDSRTNWNPRQRNRCRPCFRMDHQPRKDGRWESHRLARRQTAIA
jgi:hypothetical protein